MSKSQMSPPNSFPNALSADVKKENLRFLHAGKEITDGLPLTAQSLRHDSIVHLIRTQVHPLLKANRLPKPDQPSKPPGAFKKK